MNRIAPIEDRILIEELSAESTTAAGIVIPDSAQDKSTRGFVVAVGPGKIVNGHRIALDVRVGDTVIFTPYAGTEVKHEGRTYAILAQQEVLAVLR